MRYAYLAKICFCGFLHFIEDHGWDFLSREGLFFPFVLYFDHGFTCLIDHCEWPMFHVGLYWSIVEFSADQTLGIYNEEANNGLHSNSARRRFLNGKWWRTCLSDKLTHEQAPHQKLCCWGSWRLGFWLRRRPAFLCLWTLHNWGWFGYPDRWRWFPPSHAGKLQHRNMWYQDLFQWLAVLACSCCWKKISPSLKYKFETKKQIIESINQPILNHQIIFLFIIILKLTKNAIFVDNKTFSPHVMSTCWLTKGWMKILSKLKKMIIFIQLNKISCSTKSLDLTFFKIDIPDVLFLPLSPLLNFTGLLLRPACPDL